MKPITFNTDSWHYYVASNLGKIDASQSTDICTYTRAFLRGLISGVVAVGILLAVVGGGLWVTGVTLAFWAYLLLAEPGASITVGATEAIGTIVAISGLFWWTGYWLGEQFRKRQRALYYKRWDAELLSPPDSFISKAYKAFKERTCVRVVLVTTNPEPNEDD